MEEAILQNKDLTKQVLAELNGAFFRRERKGHQLVLKTSSQWANLSGFTENDTKDKLHFSDLIFQEDKEYVFEKINNSIKENLPWNISYRLLTKDGTVKWVEEKGSPIEDVNGETLLLDAYISEILQENTSKFQTLSYQKAVDTCSIVSITDLSGKILYVNDLFCHYSRYSKEELIGKNHRIINSGLHPKSFFKDLWETITSGKIWRGEIRNISKDGRYYWVDTVISPIFGKDGELIQFLSIRNIISEKKQTEHIVKTIYEGLSMKPGKHFFSDLTEFCCKMLHVEYAFVGLYNAHDNTVETISFKKNGVDMENFTYPIEGSPCKEILTEQSKSYLNNVQKHFPNNQRLKDLGAQSFLGKPIINEKKEVVGLLVLLDTKPMKDLFDKEFVLNFVSTRIEKEISILKVTAKLEETEELADNLLSSLSSQIAIMDYHGDIEYVNGICSKNLIESNTVDLSFSKIGSNYIDTLALSIKNNENLSANEILLGIEDLLNQKIDNFQLEFTCLSQGKERLFLFTASIFTNNPKKLVLNRIELFKPIKLSISLPNEFG